MSTLNVPHLADYRRGRAKRSEQITALYRGDPARACLGHLASSAQELLGADRAAIVWLDEYGPGLVHVHCLLDLVGNPPRRNFTAQACRVAWSKGVPGLLDAPDAERTNEILISGVRSSCCVAMGSDGTRTWKDRPECQPAVGVLVWGRVPPCKGYTGATPTPVAERGGLLFVLRHFFHDCGFENPAASRIAVA